MSEVTLAQFEALVARVAALESKTPAPQAEALADHQLENSWADKEITKDPKFYNGPTMVGRKYSEAPSVWHEANASLYEWKAKKGREETPVRLKNNGKPWHESDTFEAKLSRAWARRNAGKPLDATPAPAAPSGDPDALPF